jgi:hypothetical protein
VARRIGHQKHYQANAVSPLYSELRSSIAPTAPLALFVRRLPRFSKSRSDLQVDMPQKSEVSSSHWSRCDELRGGIELSGLSRLLDAELEGGPVMVVRQNVLGLVATPS